MLIKFWGVRGLIPVPGTDTVEFGGNTSCVEVLTDNGTKLIFDAGTGIRLLGNELMIQEFATGQGVAHMFFTYSHWDHIQGFPFFVPVYIGQKDSVGGRIENRCNEFYVYGQHDLPETILRQQMANAYFPVDLNYLSAKIYFTNLVNNQVQIGDSLISAIPLNSAKGMFAYRICELNKVTLVAPVCRPDPDGSIYKNLMDAAKDIDLLILDSQIFTRESSSQAFEYPNIWQEKFYFVTQLKAIKSMIAAGVKRVAITHYSPFYPDTMLREIASAAKEIDPNIIFAKEGMNIEI